MPLLISLPPSLLSLSFTYLSPLSLFSPPCQPSRFTNFLLSWWTTSSAIREDMDQKNIRLTVLGAIFMVCHVDIGVNSSTTQHFRERRRVVRDVHADRLRRLFCVLSCHWTGNQVVYPTIPPSTVSSVLSLSHASHFLVD